MASVELSRRVEKVVGYPPLSEMSDRQRREFHEALLDAEPDGRVGQRVEKMTAEPTTRAVGAGQSGTWGAPTWAERGEPY